MLQTGLSSSALAERTVVDEEPNDTPHTAVEFSGAAVLAGTMSGSDQDAYRWLVSDEDASRRWTLELDGIPGRLTIAEFITLDYDDAGDVTRSDQHFTIATRDGTHTVVAENLLVEPGKYLLGIAQSGGGASYRPPVTSVSFDEESSGFESETHEDTGPYRVRLIEGAPIVTAGGVQHVDRASAHILRRNTETGSFLTTVSSAWYRIEITEADANLRSNIHIQVPVGRTIHAILSRSDGELMTEGASDLLGKLSFPELALPPGEYFIEVQPRLDAGEFPGYIHNIILEEDGQRIEGDEAEPNGSWRHANSIAFSNCCAGRIGESGDRDYFAFDVDAARSDALQSVSLQSDSESPFYLCLVDQNGIEIHCREGVSSIVLGNLLLPAGSYGVFVTRGNPGDGYRLSFDTGGEPVAGQETEPNDKIDYATGTPANNRIKGTFDSRGDVDFYRFVIADEPQLWRVQAIGDGLARITYHDGSGHQNQVRNAAPGDRRLRLENLYLLPGVHHVSVTSNTPGDYTLLARKLGPPDPNGEFEPNDDKSRMQLLRIGQTRTGLLADQNDIDMYRFYLANEDHVRITIEPAADGQIDAELLYNASYSGNTVESARGVVGPVVLQDRFPPGDYYLKLSARQPSDAQYTVSLERLDPFRCDEGCASNAAVAPSASMLRARLELQFDERSVSAYEQVGQRVAGRFLLRNDDAAEMTAKLDAHASDARWQLQFERDEVTVAPGGQASVGVALLVGPDAWADIPVQVAVRAMSQDGRFTSTVTDFSVSRDMPPVNAVHASRVPETLQGGIDVARIQFGAVPSSEPEAQYPPQNLLYAFDGRVAVNTGPEFASTRSEPLAITVDLVGDAPIPIAGFAVNPIARPYLHRTPRDVEFQLSADGNNFETVLAGEVNTVGIDQLFALNEPVQASHARLLVHNNWFKGTDYGYTLGGFKVIAEPGVDPLSGVPINIADPALGGHVVWANPWISPGWDNVLLTDSADHPYVRVPPRRILEWVIGFSDDRAAQISTIEWTESDQPTGTDPIDTMMISVSIDSPVGPWQPIAEWDRARADISIELAEPAWARFVRFAVPPSEKARSLRVPDHLRILERPTGPDYRSVLGEWGYRSGSAYFESTQSVVPPPGLQSRGNVSREMAAPLAAGSTETGFVRLGEQSHWYRVAVPSEHNTVQFELSGEPTVRTELAVTDNAGDSLPVRRIETGSTSARHRYEATVTSGHTIYVEVREPPRNVMFLWDTSPSVNPYLPMIYNSMIAYAEDLVPGRDAANLLPFGSSTPLLQDWYGEPYLMQMILNDYPRRDSSSSAEFTQYAAANLLASRSGTKAIVMITDSSTPRFAEIWDAFREVKPRVFVMKIASDAVDPVAAEAEQDLSQDWARVNGGYYSYLANEGEMEIAFDRAATMLRRPAGYALTLETEHREAPGPGSLKVTASDQRTSAGAVELILDASGSMWQKLDGRFRIDIAKDVLTTALTEHIPPDTPTALRVFGHRLPNACDSNLELPLAPLDIGQSVAAVREITPQSLARTPIAASLAAVATDLGANAGTAIVVIVTDGQETCGGDPAVEIEKLQAAGIQLSLNIVGFAIDDKQLAEQFEDWAKAGGGRYFGASDAVGLNSAVKNALSTPYAVFDRSGEPVADGIVGGDPIKLSQGKYKVVVATTPQRVFENVSITGGRHTDLAL